MNKQKKVKAYIRRLKNHYPYLQTCAVWTKNNVVFVADNLGTFIFEEGYFKPLV